MCATSKVALRRCGRGFDSNSCQFCVPRKNFLFIQFQFNRGRIEEINTGIHAAATSGHGFESARFFFSR